MISVVSAARDLGRLREITSVLVRHGFGEVVARAGLGRKSTVHVSEPPPTSRSHGLEDAREICSADIERGDDERKRISTAKRLRLVLQDLGPSFIKLGQLASTRRDALPPDVIAELEKLQDDVPPIPFVEVKEAIETSLGAPIAQTFLWIDEEPLATASIGQVHRAVFATLDGDREVVVKVQRPNVAATVRRDLELLHLIATTIERTIPETRIYSPTGLVRQFERSIIDELDFRIEGENAARFMANFEGTPHAEVVRFPKVYKQASSREVLTLEFFDGLKIDEAIARGVAGQAIARNAVGVVIKMIFEDGFFHADPHPGNVIIMGGLGDAPPVIGLVDLGMVGRLSPELRDRTVDLLIAAARKDTNAVADALYAIGRPTTKVDMRAYRAEVALLGEKYLGKPLAEIDLASLLGDIVCGAMKYGIEVPTEFLLVGKAIVTLDGIGKKLDPHLDVFEEGRPYFVRILRKRYSPQRIGNGVIRGFEQLSRAGHDVPLQICELLEDLRLGRMELRTIDPALPAATDRLGRRVFSGFVIAAATIGGAATTSHDHTVARVLFAIAAAILVLHLARDRLRGTKAAG